MYECMQNCSLGFENCGFFKSRIPSNKTSKLNILSEKAFDCFLLNVKVKNYLLLHDLNFKLMLNISTLLQSMKTCCLCFQLLTETKYNSE